MPTSPQAPIELFEAFPVSRKSGTGGWKKLGGVWPQRVNGASPEYQLYYCVLRDCMQVLVDFHDAKMKQKNSTIRKLEPEVSNVLDWIFDDKSDAPLKLRDVARAAGFQVRSFRAFIKDCGILS